MKPASIVLLMFIVLLANSCRKNFFPDMMDARLPRYSEEGRNVAGARADDMAWTIGEACSRAQPSIHECDNWYTFFRQDSSGAHVYLRNGWLWLDEAGSKRQAYQIGFHFKHLRADSLELLHLWEGLELDLDGSDNIAMLGPGDWLFPVPQSGDSCTTVSGKLYIRKARPQFNADSDLISVILSGTFAFTLDGNCHISQVTHGRFDFGVSHQHWN